MYVCRYALLHARIRYVRLCAQWGVGISRGWRGDKNISGFGSLRARASSLRGCFIARKVATSSSFDLIDEFRSGES